MPMFAINGAQLSPVRPTNFEREKDLQGLIEQSLRPVFDCRFIATEFPTGSIHGGRIDTLAISEENNPVIVEYKKIESSDLINQSLFYLSWIRDHRGDFELAAHKALGANIEVDWTDVRVICIAPGYKKYDIHAVQVMGANIELWQYRLFDNGTMYLEEVFRRRAAAALASAVEGELAGKNPVMVAAGKKAAITRASGVYTVDQHLDKAPPELREIVESLREFILSIDDSIEEIPKKFYLAYKVSQNFVCMVILSKKIVLYLNSIRASTSHCPLMRRIFPRSGTTALATLSSRSEQPRKPSMQKH